MVESFEKQSSLVAGNHDTWSSIAADAYAPRTNNLTTGERSTSPNFSAKSGAADGLVQKAVLSIEPCTPQGQDPRKDPANPASPNYDAPKFAPRPAGSEPIVPHTNGVISPQELEQRRTTGPVYEPAYGAYSGMCEGPQPPKKQPDYSKVPMS